MSETSTPPKYTLAVRGAVALLVHFSALVFYWNGPELHSRTAREVFAWLTVLPLVWVFWSGWRLVKESGADVRMLLGFAAAFALVALFTTPYHSTDVFGYINRGWQAFHYGMDPYVFTVSEVPARELDPMLREHWIYNPNPYGFLFTDICYLVCWLGQGNWWLTLLLIKLVNVGAYAATAALLWFGAKAIGVEKPVRPLYLFLWNPVVIVQNLANGHNDLIVGCLVLAAFYAAIRKSYFWVLPIVSAGVLIKYAPIVVLPFAVILVWRKIGGIKTIASAVVAGLLAFATSAPFIADWRSFRLQDIRDNAVLLDNSLHSFLFHIYKNLLRLAPRFSETLEPASDVIAWIIRLTVLGILIWLFIRFCRRADEEHFIKYSCVALFLLIFVASSKLNGWYVGMLIGPVLLLDAKYWLRRLMTILSGTEMLSITFFKQAYIVNYLVEVLLPQIYVFRRWRLERGGQ